MTMRAGPSMTPKVGAWRLSFLRAMPQGSSVVTTDGQATVTVTVD
jgi:hypothetical protein